MELSQTSMKVSKLSSENIREDESLTTTLLEDGPTSSAGSSNINFRPLSRKEEEKRISLWANQGDLWQDAGQDAHHQLSKTRGKWYSKAWHFFQTVLFLIVLGMCSSIAAQFVELVCSGLFSIRKSMSGIDVAPAKNFTNLEPPSKVTGLQGFLFVLYN